MCSDVDFIQLGKSGKGEMINLAMHGVSLSCYFYSAYCFNLLLIAKYYWNFLNSFFLFLKVLFMHLLRAKNDL